MGRQLISNISILLCVVILTGCLETRIVDEVSMVRAATFDLAENNRIRITANFPTFPEDGVENTLEDGLISATGETTKGTRVILNKRAQKPLLFGQLRVLLFSEQLAEQGIETYIDAMYRDPAVGNRIFLAISEGDQASSYLIADKQGGELSGVYLPDLIEQNMDTSILPPTNMHEFLFSLYNDGRDPYLPMLKQSEEAIYVWGTALFSDDKLHLTLDHDDSFILKMLVEDARQVTKQFEINDGENEEYVVVENLSSTVTRDIDKTGPNPKFSVHIDMLGAIQDYSGNENLESQETIKNIESAVEERITKYAEDLLKQLQSESIDPIGIGEKYRSTTRNWDPEEWKGEIYPSLEFDVSVQLKIIQSGAVE